MKIIESKMTNSANNDLILAVQSKPVWIINTFFFLHWNNISL